MTQYINKDALVAKIESLRKYYIERDDYDNGWNFALDKILSIIETLEVKKVDFDKLLSDLDKAIKEFVTTEEFESFLLGLKAQEEE